MDPAAPPRPDLEIFLLRSYARMRRRTTPLPRTQVKFKKVSASRCTGLEPPFNLCGLLRQPDWKEISQDPLALKTLRFEVIAKQPRLCDYTTVTIRGEVVEGKYHYAFFVKRKDEILGKKSVSCSLPWDFGGLREYVRIHFPIQEGNSRFGLENIDKIASQFEISVSSDLIWVDDERGRIMTTITMPYGEQHPCTLWMRTPLFKFQHHLLPAFVVRENIKLAEDETALSSAVQERLWFKYEPPNRCISFCLIFIDDHFKEISEFVRYYGPSLLAEYGTNNLEANINAHYYRTIIQAISFLYKEVIPIFKAGWDHFTVKAYLRQFKTDTSECTQKEIDETAAEITKEIEKEWHFVKEIAELDVDNLSNCQLLQKLELIMQGFTEFQKITGLTRLRRGPFILSEGLEQALFAALDKLGFKEILEANCSDFEDPVGANRGLFWRYTLPFAFEKFVMASIKAFLTLEVPQRYMCNFEGKNSQLVPADDGVVYTQKVQGQQLVLQANSVILDGNKQTCHWPDGIRLNNRSWEYTRADTAWAFAKRQKDSANLLIVDFSKFRVDGQVLSEMCVENPICDMKFVSNGKTNTLLLLANNNTGYLREVAILGSEAPLSILREGKAHLSQLLFGEQAHGFSTALKKIVVRLVDKSNEDHEPLFKESEDLGSDNEDDESEELDGQEDGHEKQKLSIELETKHIFSNKVLLEGLDVDKQKRLFVYGRKLLSTQNVEPVEDGEEEYPIFDLYDLFVLIFDSNSKSLTLQNGFWISADTNRKFFRCEKSFREWRADEVKDKDILSRRQKWGNLSQMTCISSFPNVSLLLITRNYEFSVVGYNHKNKQFFLAKPPAAIFDDISKLPGDHEVFLEASTQTINLLQLPARSNRNQAKWTRSWQSGPLFVLEQYRLHI